MDKKNIDRTPENRTSGGVLTRPVGLSARLTAIVGLAGQGHCLCDVGCDHAHVPIRLLQEGKFDCAIAMDVIEGPLEKAAGNIRLYGMADRIELRLSDGLDACRPGEADTLVITGMGGTLMEEILLRTPARTKSFRALVLGPQSDPDKVRAALRLLGAHPEEEQLVYEDGKYYPVIRAVFPGNTELQAEEKTGEESARTVPGFAPDIPDGLCREAMDLFGPLLLSRRDPVLHEYLRRQTAVLEKILRSVSRAAAVREENLAKKEEIRHSLEIFRAALTVYGPGQTRN